MAIQITTTNSFENSTIIKYFTPITSNVVVGTNIFGDITASLTDIFGGRSESYESRLQSIFQQALSNIEKQSAKIGANGLIGLKIDYDEISGKGMQMFMVSVTGTPVILNQLQQINLPSQQSVVSGEIVDQKIKAKRLKDAIKDFPINKIGLEDLEKIKNSNLTDYLILLPDWINELDFDVPLIDEKNAVETILKYLENQSFDEFKQFIYEYLFSPNPKNIKKLAQLVAKREAIDFQFIYDKLEEVGGNSSALMLLGEKKTVYDRNDLKILKMLMESYDLYFPLKSTVREEENKGLFSKGLIKIWDCPCGKKVNSSRCSACGKDIYGYDSKTPHPPILKKYLNEKIEVLEEVFKPND
ncbi:YbjQ family protein [Sphingobacterium lactis]|uniref:YbjQ family protein n=1 Tax=Sphingobacterium lactis TaxID=797291 RepID=UPI003DA478E9